MCKYFIYANLGFNQLSQFEKTYLNSKIWPLKYIHKNNDEVQNYRKLIRTKIKPMPTGVMKI